MSEFDLIRRHFITPNTLGSGPTRASHVALGPGDDCALAQVRPGDLLAVSSDMLVAGRHFFEDVSPAKLGHKALAVNLSDLAAMGAEPKSFTLALALPQTDDAWLAAFSQGLMQLANVHQCALIGGDITRGPLTIAITVMGEVAPEHALRRDGAKPGEDIYVSGTLGDAALALQWTANHPDDTMVRSLLSRKQIDAVIARMETPTPRIELGRALRRLASAAMDVSDGLAGDLVHLLRASGCGAQIDLDSLPCSEVLALMAPDTRRRIAFAGGDDYELLFTAPPTQRAAMADLSLALGLPLTRIGQTTETTELVLRDHAGAVLPNAYRGYDHFMPTASDPTNNATPSPTDTSAVRPTWRFMFGHPARLLALGFGSGLTRFAPGTVGTLWAWVAFLALSPLLSSTHWLWLITGGFFLGCWACKQCAKDMGIADSGHMVWDEVIAFWLVLWLIMPAGLLAQLLAFGLFRFFDAVKFGPTKWADQRFKGFGWVGGFGVMFDDLIAAGLTLFVWALGLHWLPTLWPR